MHATLQLLFGLAFAETISASIEESFLGVGLLVVMMIWMELCTTYSSSCHRRFHHPLLQ